MYFTNERNNLGAGSVVELKVDTKTMQVEWWGDNTLLAEANIPK